MELVNYTVAHAPQGGRGVKACKPYIYDVMGIYGYTCLHTTQPERKLGLLCYPGSDVSSQTQTDKH